MVPSFSYIRARSLDEAIRYLSLDGARAHAGGTDLLGCLRDRVFDLTTVVSIVGLKELRGIEATPAGGLRIGSLTTIAEVARHPVIESKYRALSMAASEVASPQLRHQGTIGGNLCQKPRCWYYRGEFQCLRKGGDQCYAVEGQNPYHCIFGGENCFIVHPSDTAPALVALQASVVIAGPNGIRGKLPYAAIRRLHEGDRARTRRDRSRNRPAAAGGGPAKFLPQGSGTTCLGLCSGRRGPGDCVQRRSGNRYPGSAQRRSARALALR
jgi:CO/xanthine dehydrogenase FAD-binding subunit